MPTSQQPIVAYFSAEYAMADDLPIYAGGLGILAADIVLEAGRGVMPFYAIGLVYHSAFTGDDTDQRPMTERLIANGYQLARGNDGQRLEVIICVADRKVALQAWSKNFGPSRILLLDSHIDSNAPQDQAICDKLYAADLALELAQEITLGFGGMAILNAIGVTPDVYHLNEGHTGPAGLAIVLSAMKRNGSTFAAALSAMKPHIVGTKHTILSGAGIFVDWGTVERQMGAALMQANATIDDIKPLATRANGDYSDTLLMINLTHLTSGVSQIHVNAELRAHQSSTLIAITNGVSRTRWIAPAWGDAPAEFSDAKLWATHYENRRQLLAFVKETDQTELDPDTLTVVWARRMTAYKQPGLLVEDLDRLDQLINRSAEPIQFIVAGKANPADTVGVKLMNRIEAASQDARLKHRFAYLPHYNPASAKFLVRGADLWLNTPIRGYEACGTSGMKASLNGALQFSTSDGWIDEVTPDPIGWILPEGAPSNVLYDTLGKTIAPLYYDQTDGIPTAWVQRMRANITLIEENFTTTRMLADYYEKLYRPSV